MTADKVTMSEKPYPPPEYKEKLLREFIEKSGIDHLRLMVKNFDYCNEGFNEQFTVEELFKIHRAWQLSGWDMFPDQWTERQIQEALDGHVPEWDDERPVYRQDEP